MLTIALENLEVVLKLLAGIKKQDFYNEKGEVIKSVPVKLAGDVSWGIDKATRQLSEEYKEFMEKRNALLEEYGEKDENGQAIKYKRRNSDNDPWVPADPKDQEWSYKIEDLAGYIKEFNDLANIEIEIKFTPFSMAKIANVPISPDEIGVLKFFGFMEKDEDEIAEEKAREEKLKLEVVK